MGHSPPPNPPTIAGRRPNLPRLPIDFQTRRPEWTSIYPKLNEIIKSSFLGWRRFGTVIEVFNGDTFQVKLSRNKPLRKAAQVDDEKDVSMVLIKIVGNSSKKIIS